MKAILYRYRIRIHNTVDSWEKRGKVDVCDWLYLCTPKGCGNPRRMLKKDWKTSILLLKFFNLLCKQKTYFFTAQKRLKLYPVLAYFLFFIQSENNLITNITRWRQNMLKNMGIIYTVCSLTRWWVITFHKFWSWTFKCRLIMRGNHRPCIVSRRRSVKNNNKKWQVFNYISKSHHSL